MWKQPLLLATLAALLAGCTSPAQSPDSSPSPTSSAPAATEGYVDVELSWKTATHDGLLWDVDNATMSLLVFPMCGETPEEWDDYARGLQKDRIRVVAVSESNVKSLEKARAMLDYVMSRNETRVTIIGASCGGDAALEAAANLPCIGALAQLSAYDTDTAKWDAVGARPVFMAAAPLDADSYILTQQNRLYETRNQRAVTYAEGSGRNHGTQMFEDAAVKDALDRWIRAGPSTCKAEGSSSTI